MTPRDKLQEARAQVAGLLVERDDEVDCCYQAVLANEGCLGVGQPGTAKSLLGRLVAASLDARVFEVLLTMFTPPEAIFGPLKISALKADRYERVLDGGAADCEFLILDEVN